MNVDIEIYLSNLIKFFRENPKDLLSLVPKNKEQEFYTKIREIATDNHSKGREIILTQKQLIDICVTLNGKNKVKSDPLEEKVFVKFKEFTICLN